MGAVEDISGRLMERIRQAVRERFTLHAWADGYCIYDRGELIATFHGPQFELASKTLRLLREDAGRPPEPQPAA